MTFFDDVLYRTRDVAEAAGRKASDFIDITRLKMQAADIEREIASVFEGIGRLIYDSRKEGEDVSELVDNGIVRIDELQAKRDAVRAQIDEFRNILRCTQCGVANPLDALYCKRCGKKLI